MSAAGTTSQIHAVTGHLRASAVLTKRRSMCWRLEDGLGLPGLLEGRS